MNMFLVLTFTLTFIRDYNYCYIVSVTRAEMEKGLVVFQGPLPSND